MSSAIKSTRQASIHVVGPRLGCLPKDVSTHSLHATGVMALFCVHVEYTICLLGRQCLDGMLRYLTMQAHPIMRDFLHHMLVGGNYLLLPNQDILKY
jgi:hypothetical protein